MQMPSTCIGCGLLSRVGKFLSSPITSTASNTEWWLFIGAILIVAYLWSRMLRLVTEELG